MPKRYIRQWRERVPERNGNSWFVEHPENALAFSNLADVRGCCELLSEMGVEMPSAKGGTFICRGFKSEERNSGEFVIFCQGPFALEPFGHGIKEAIVCNDKKRIGRLISTVPKGYWSYPIPCAQATFEGINISVRQLSGGSGINIYEVARVAIWWEWGTTAWFGDLSSEELRLPNYIPLSKREVRKFA